MIYLKQMAIHRPVRKYKGSWSGIQGLVLCQVVRILYDCFTIHYNKMDYTISIFIYHYSPLIYKKIIYIVTLLDDTVQVMVLQDSNFSVFDRMTEIYHGGMIST